MSALYLLRQSMASVLKHNHDGSFETQANRKKILFQIAEEISQGGFKLRHIYGLRKKHVEFLVNRWQERNLSAGTIKNRRACLVWICEKIGKDHVVPSSNSLNISKRIYIDNRNRAITLSKGLLSKINDPHVQLSLSLQEHFGLRRQEAMKIKPYQADQGDYLVLQGSWCKNGRPRKVPILNTSQRKLLNYCKKFIPAAQHSLIPRDKTYVEQLKIYEYQTNRAGIKNPHGLRHAYAQRRYQELTGWACPARGGKRKDELTAKEETIDFTARIILSEELGHSRLSIVSLYVGR